MERFFGEELAEQEFQAEYRRHNHWRTGWTRLGNKERSTTT